MSEEDVHVDDGANGESGQEDGGAASPDVGSKRGRAAAEEEQEEESGGNEDAGAAGDGEGAGDNEANEGKPADAKKARSGPVADPMAAVAAVAATVAAEPMSAVAQAAARINASYSSGGPAPVAPGMHNPQAAAALAASAPYGAPAAQGRGPPVMGHAPMAQGATSPVLHVRNLPHDVQEQELYALAAPFGQVVKVLAMRNKGQAFVQMATTAMSMEMLRYYQGAPPNIRGRTAYMQFSRHQELAGGTAVGAMGTMAAPSTNDPGAPNKIIMARISNLLYPITIEVLQKVFSKFGEISRIVICQPKEGSQDMRALIEYPTVQEAAQAMTQLTGQDIYAGCCTLNIVYSRQDHLTVRYNNARTRDFTNPDLPTGSMGGGGGGRRSSGGFGGAGGVMPTQAAMYQAFQQQQQQRQMGGFSGGYGR